MKTQYINSVVILIALLMTLTSCHSSFVGTLTYTTSIEANSPEYIDDAMNYRARYGDSLAVEYFANGDMKRFHKNSDQLYGINYQWYCAENSEIYFVGHDGTIDTFPTAVNSLVKIRQYTTADELIAGMTCHCYKVEALDIHDNTPVELSICYPYKNSGLKVNHRLYRGYRDFFLYDFFREAKAPYLKYHMKFLTVTIRYDGVEIMNRKQGINRNFSK